MGAVFSQFSGWITVDMFEQFTESARRLVWRARLEARHGGAAVIDAGHLCRAMTQDAKGLVAQILARAGVPLTGVVDEEVHSYSTQNAGAAGPTDMHFSEDAGRALEYAAQEARDLRHRYIGSEHLLLGLLRIETSGAPPLLTGHGLSADAVRREIVRALQEDSLATPSGISPAAAALWKQLEQVQRLVEQLARTPRESSEAEALMEHISQLLDIVKRDVTASRA